MLTVARCAFLLVLLTGAAFAADAPKTALGQNDAGKVYFSTAGSILQAGSRVAMKIQEAPTTLSGDLKFPDGPGPFPAVIFAHGCAGNGYAEKTWTPLLLQWGYATFAVDSFSDRRIWSGICEDVSRLFPVQRIPDVYGALRILASHPKVKPDRIALMGFSHGGIVTMHAATQWAQDTFAAEGRPRFRAYFPIYPYCNPIIPEWEAVTAPVRVHTGALDDWTPAKPCQDWAERLRAKGFDVTVTIYPDAHHAFDDPFGAPVKVPKVINLANCFPKYKSILGPSEEDNPFAKCANRGATVGRNVKAIKTAEVELHTQLDQLVGAK